MKLLSIHVPPGYIAELNDLVRRGIFSTKSEAVRHAIRLLLDRYKEGTPHLLPG